MLVRKVPTELDTAMPQSSVIPKTEHQSIANDSTILAVGNVCNEGAR